MADDCCYGCWNCLHYDNGTETKSDVNKERSKEKSDDMDWCCADPKLYPRLDREHALLCYVLNCFPITSGFGTMISVCCND